MGAGGQHQPERKLRLGERMLKWLKRPAAHPWQYWLTHVLFAVIATIPVGGVIVHRLHPKTPFETVWQGILGQQRSVPIRIADVPGQEIDIPPYGKTRVPKNVPFVGIAESLGISELREALSLSGITPDLCLQNEFGSKQRDRSFVTVGGPSINKTTRQLVLSWNEKEKRFESTHEAWLDGQLVIYYPSHRVVDFAHPDDKDPSKPTIFNPDEGERGDLGEDFGFVVIAPNKLKEGAYSVALFGVWPPGTQAAVHALVRPEEVAKDTHFVAMIRQRKPIVAVVKTFVGDLTSEGAKILYVRDLNPERIPAQKANQYATAYVEK